MIPDKLLADAVRKAQTTKRIKSFWDWFATNCNHVATAYATDDERWLGSNITPRIKAIQPSLNWELGPYRHPEQTLIISPTIRENLKLSEDVVTAAPEVAAWHFLPAKPPKQLNSLVMKLPGRQGAEVCADDWMYQLTAYNQMEFFDIEVFTDTAADRVEKTNLLLLTRLLIEALVGERLFLERFADVKVYRPLEQQAGEKASPFPVLGRHLTELFRFKSE
jgi:hypothetical protein